MSKKLIRLTESDLHRVIKESVNKILNEMDGTELNDFGYNARELRNMLGDYDDDELNVAVEAEEAEELEGDIWKSISKIAHGNPYKVSFKFSDMANMLNDEYNFEYDGCDEDDESHKFSNPNYELYIYPNVFFEKQGTLKLLNLHIMRKR